MRVASPMNGDPICFCILLKLFKVMSKIRKRVLLDLRSEVSQLLPFGNLQSGLIPPHSRCPQDFVETLLMDVVFHEFHCCFRLVNSAHRVTPLSISAIWRNGRSWFSL